MFDRSKERPVAGHTYYAPQGGLPKQTDLMTGRAVFTQAYAVIPKGVMRDIVTSFLPFWQDTRAWVLARPLSGFAETFSQYIMEVGPGGGSDRPEPDANAEGVFFVVEGELTVTLAGKAHVLQPGGYAYFPPTSAFSVRNESTGVARFHWIRKAYEAVEGLELTRRSRGSTRPRPSSPAKTTSPRPRCRTPMANGRQHASSTRRTCVTTCM
jgi:(S)-ureidoglycine aminohydrolase